MNDLKHAPDPDQDQIIPNPQHCFFLFSQDLSQFSKYAALDNITRPPHFYVARNHMVRYWNTYILYKRRKDQRLSNDQITCEKFVFRTDRSEPESIPGLHKKVYKLGLGFVNVKEPGIHYVSLCTTGGIEPLESIPGLLKRLQIRSHRHQEIPSNYFANEGGE
jgi:hypothetical protein